MCPACGASLRYRHQAAVLIDELSEEGSASLAELVLEPHLAAARVYEPGIEGPFRRYLASLPGYTNSYLWDGVPRGKTHRGTRCEDLQDLTLPDDSVDLVVSSDILEHVREPVRAFTELRRVLRPGGLHVFTVPLAWPLPEQTLSRVEAREDGEERPAAPAVYHSSPTDPRGSLVYTDFGLDLPARLDALGYETRIQHGPQYNLTFVARVPFGDAAIGVRAFEPTAPAPLEAAEASQGGLAVRGARSLLRALLPPTPARVRMAATYLALRRSGQFDAHYYLRANPDVALARVDPLMHFVEHGWASGRDPRPGFDTRGYLEANPEVARAGINPLLHHVRHRTGRRQV